MKRLIISLFAITIMASCAKNENLGQDGDSAVQFTGESVTTRLNDDGSMWSEGDKISVSMSRVDDQMVVSDDIKYSATKGGSSTTSFKIADGYSPIFYPTGSDVTFNAFYGDKSIVASIEGVRVIYSDISDQSDFSAIELMVADPVTVAWADGANTEEEVAFSFEHKLSKVVFNVTCNETLEDANLVGNISAYFTEIACSAVFDPDGGLIYNAQCLHSNRDTLSIQSIALDTTYVTQNKKEVASASSGTMIALIYPCSNDGTDEEYGYEPTKLNINIEYDGSTIKLEAPFSPTNLTSGYTYSYDVTIGRDYIDLDAESFKIIGWDDVVESPIDSELTTTYGTVDNPYLVTSAADMAKIGVSEDYPLDGCYKLLCDINLNNQEWTPIGTESTKFTGVFDGDGYSIKGLNLARNECNLGLFGFLGAEGVVKNLSVYGNVGSASTSGTLDFYDNCSYLENIAAIAGSNYGSVINCHNYAEVNIGYTSNEIQGAGYYIRYIGGVVGYNNGGTIAYCSNSGAVTVSGTIQSGDINSIGGVVGRVFDNSNVIVNCYNLANITANQDSKGGDSVGGVIGNVYSISDDPYVVNCYNYGTITGYRMIGGVVGSVDDKGAFYACYNVGDVNAVNTDYINGFYGYGEHASYTNCCTARDATGYVEDKIDGVGISAGDKADFMTENMCTYLNTGADAYNATSPAIEAATWMVGSGNYLYSVFDMSSASSY